MLTLYRDGPNPTKAFGDLVGQGELEADTFVKLRSAPLPLEGAETLAELLRPSDKVGAIPVAPDTAFRVKTKTVTVSTDEEGPLDVLALAQDRIPSASITDVEVLDDKVRTRLETHKSKKRVTHWDVVDDHGIVNECKSVSAACALAKKLASSSAPPIAYHVRGSVGGEGSRMFATYKQRQTGRRVKVRITYAETTRRDPAPTGWLFVAH